jgi:hypothetical protein
LIQVCSTFFTVRFSELETAAAAGFIAAPPDASAPIAAPVNKFRRVHVVFIVRLFLGRPV